MSKWLDKVLCFRGIRWFPQIPNNSKTDVSFSNFAIIFKFNLILQLFTKKIKCFWWKSLMFSVQSQFFISYWNMRYNRSIDSLSTYILSCICFIWVPNTEQNALNLGFEWKEFNSISSYQFLKGQRTIEMMKGIRKPCTCHLQRIDHISEEITWRTNWAVHYPLPFL